MERIFCLGNALYDLSILCDSALLEKYHLKPDENTEATSKHDELFLNILNDKNAYQSAGGSAQNTSRIIQWMLGDGNDEIVTFVGSVGKDAFAQKLSEIMKNSKVRAIYDEHIADKTGITAALVTNDAKRSLCARLGAVEKFNQDFLYTPLVNSEMYTAKIIYVEGYFLSHSPSCVIYVAEFSKQHNKVFALNLSAPYICKNQFNSLMQCVLLTDFLFSNEEEAQMFAQKCKLPYSSIEDCALAISSLPSKIHKQRIVVITQGPNPVVIAAGDKVTTHKVHLVKNIADTIGCGDAFVGGFLTAVFLNKSIDKAASWGIYCAREIAKQRGCTIPPFQPNIEEI